MIIVDRILNGIAVCEVDGIIQDISLSSIDGAVCEGDVLRQGVNEERYTVDTAETQKRRAALTERFDRIKTRHKRMKE